MTIVSKTAGALSLTSCFVDMHKCGKLYANKAKAKTSANLTIESSLSAQMLDSVSFKDAQIKNWAQRSQMFFGIREKFAAFKGYIRGFVEAGTRYIPNLALATIAMLSSSKKHSKFAAGVANIATIALGLLHGVHFFNVATGVGQKKDYLA